MAKVVKDKFPLLFSPEWPWSLTGSAFTCLEILGCNSRRPWSFLDARLDFAEGFSGPLSGPSRKGSFVETVPEKYIFRGVMYDLVFNETVKKEAVDRALENLGNFLINGKSMSQ